MNDNDKEIKVGDYIRTIDGCIAKVININEFREPSMKYGVEANYFKDVLFTGDDKIKKHSSNIIDLIEVGDYVNGDKIISISEDPFIKSQINLWTERHEVNSFGDTERIKYFYRKNDIKSIVTKEQFENAEYKVEE